MSEEDLEDYEELEDEDPDEVIRAKWSMDGAETLPDAASRLREFADSLDRLHREGWKLREPVEDDYGFIYQETP